MSNILTLVEVAPTGVPADSTAGLLAAAAALGTPVAVVAVAPGAGGELAPVLGALGAAHVLVAESAEVGRTLAAPQLAALDAAVERFSPAAVLLSHSIESRDVAARFSVRADGALAIDAVGVRLDGDRVIAQHSVFGGAYSTESLVEGGLPVITLRQGAVQERAAAASPEVATVAVAVTGPTISNCAGQSRGSSSSVMPSPRIPCGE